jgi:hypothetical protein
MNDKDKVKALQILKSHNYCVRVEKTGPFSYTVKYPPYSLFENKDDSFSKEYLFEDLGVVMDGECVELPLSLRRVGVLADIYSQCYHLKIHPSLIFFFNEEGKEVKNFFELVGDILEKDDLTKEQIIYKMLIGEKVSDEEQLANFRSWKLMKGLSL